MPVPFFCLKQTAQGNTHSAADPSTTDTYYAAIRICNLQTARLSADNRRIAVLNTAFGVFSTVSQHFCKILNRLNVKHSSQHSP
ncbi:hypothetical protein GCM10010946_12790 [Undibacterium squillarum]|uniref:Uncharacterized protein n=1 Tax=Undibacterium squillarum TaxID=1131567 RepID=A0ABQ2XVM8_9BURK|nr:hypothetical protein GCM10010946_12790 [Undibacterium squillarum]